jgi:hypothetical protein
VHLAAKKKIVILRPILFRLSDFAGDKRSVGSVDNVSLLNLFTAEQILRVRINVIKVLSKYKTLLNSERLDNTRGFSFLDMAGFF